MVKALAAPAGLDPETAATVAASVGESAITLGDVARYVTAQPRHLRARFATLEQRQELLRHMVDMEVLAVEAKRRGLDQDPVVQHALKDALARTLLETAVDTTVSMTEISEEAVQAHYQEHGSRYSRPEVRRAAMILTYDKADMAAIDAAIRRAVGEEPGQARQIFGDFAAEKTAHKESKHLKGDLGWFDAGGLNEERQRRVDDETAGAVFALTAVNQISAPFQLASGWAMVQLTNLRPAAARALDDVRAEIRDELLRQRKAAERERFITELRARARVEIDESELAKLKLPGDGAVGAGAPPASADLPGGFKRPKILSPRVLHQQALRPDTKRKVKLDKQEKLQKDAEEVIEEIRRKKEQAEAAAESASGETSP